MRLISLQTSAQKSANHLEDYLRRLRHICDHWAEKLIARFYGYHGKSFDSSVLLEMPEIRALVINSIYDDVENLAAISELPNLVHLSLGIFGLKDKQVLKRLRLAQLSQLLIEETQTKALDLAPLADPSGLASLALYGHKKSIEVVGSLLRLAHLTFNPAKAKLNGFLNGMPMLKSLKFALGSGDSMAGFSDLPAIEDMALTMVRGMSDLGDLQRFPSL